MTSDAIARMREQHRAIEIWLDRLLDALAAGDAAALAESFTQTRLLAQAHYAAEEHGLFLELRADFPSVVEKMRAQHEEAREIGAVCQALLEALDARDLPRVARRFHAITQHNIIEEERNLFTWAER